MIETLPAVDKITLFALGKQVAEAEKVTYVSELLERYGVAPMSEWRRRREVVEALVEPLTEVLPPKEKPHNTAIHGIAGEIIAFLMREAAVLQDNTKRRSYAPHFKQFLTDCKTRHEGVTYDDLSKLTGIEADTIKGFKDAAVSPLTKLPMADKSNRILELWRAASPWHKKTLDDFQVFVGRQDGNIAISRDQLRLTLIHLGLHYPRGPRLKNEGAEVKTKYAPHAIWEGDAKLVKIKINDKAFDFSWYAFTDQTTTLLVGSNVGKTESSQNFLSALKNGQKNVGFYSVGLLIDNRLSDEDLSPVRNFCKEHHITIIRTFPGNSKSNGFIENNFSIFERFVGAINIQGRTTEEIAASIAESFIEVFTQLRNQRGRPRFGGKSPADVAANFSRPEQARSAVERLASRLNKEVRDGELRWHLIETSRAHFGPLSEENETKIKKQLAKYPVADLISAQASFIAQIVKHPDNTYGAAYFLAILRHKREEKAKASYSEIFRAGTAIWSSLTHINPSNLDEHHCAKIIADDLIQASREPTPSHILLRLDALCFWLLRFQNAGGSISTFWNQIETICHRTNSISLSFWQRTCEYLFERLGENLFFTPL